METKYAIKTTNRDLAKRVYDYLKECNKATSSFNVQEIGSYQTDCNTWGTNVGGWVESEGYIKITDREYINMFINKKDADVKEVKQYVKMKENYNSYAFEGEIYKVHPEQNSFLRLEDNKKEGRFYYANGIYVIKNMTTPATEEEYNKQNNIMTNEQKLQELEKELSQLREEIKKDNKIKVGDYVYSEKRETKDFRSTENIPIFRVAELHQPLLWQYFCWQKLNFK